MTSTRPPKRRARHVRHHAARRLMVGSVVALVLAASAAGVLGARWVNGGGAAIIGVALKSQAPDRSDHAASRSDDRTGGTSGTPRAGDEGLSSMSPSPSPSAAKPSPSARASASAAGSPTGGTMTPAGSGVAGANPQSGALDFEQQVLTLVNQQRASNGCGALRDDPKLTVAAREHSADMANQGYFDHNSPNGATPWDRIKAAGYADPSAENIAAGQANPTDVMNAWMNSEGHRANILNCSSKAIGIGFWRGGSYGTYWTQDFGYS
jgi:uncharacterized protein YkwD